ncbi:MAG: glycolate oxidase subunit GlcE [Pseudomonadota bacterium]|nr:glycolate oxidase subunit GlcE [Pseudomonadota bacterium]
MDDSDRSQELRQAVLEASSAKKPLRIVGGDSKAFYGRGVDGAPLEVAGHRGVVAYEPTELVLTARAGTPLAEVEETLAGQRQMLAFEPPRFGGGTLGGAIACGLSGPRRPYAGAARDFVLGVRVLNGRGEVLRFGGQVMKNVAGYDLSRLMAGSLGTLGVILEVSLKVLPLPAVERTLVQPRSAAAAIEAVNRWAGKPLPLSGACHDGENLYIRLSGTAKGVQAASAAIGGVTLADDADFWTSIRDQTHGFFADAAPLWRLSLPGAAPPLDLPGRWLLDWGGAQRWLVSDAPADAIRRQAAAAGGHATLFRGGDRRGQVLHPLSPGLLALHRRLKQSFDPEGIFNPGRLYPDF